MRAAIALLLACTALVPCCVVARAGQQDEEDDYMRWVWPKSAAAAPFRSADRDRLWTRSSRLDGIEHCMLHGNLGGTNVLLHIWLKLVLLSKEEGAAAFGRISSKGSGTAAKDAGGGAAGAEEAEAGERNDEDREEADEQQDEEEDARRRRRVLYVGAGASRHTSGKRFHLGPRHDGHMHASSTARHIPQAASWGRGGAMEEDEAWLHSASLEAEEQAEEVGPSRRHLQAASKPTAAAPGDGGDHEAEDGTAAAAAAVLAVKGFAFYEDLGMYRAGKPYVQLSQAYAALTAGPLNFTLRSAATRRVLQLRSWLAHHPTMPVPVVGQLPLIAEEVQEAELELRAQGFKYLCRLPLDASSLTKGSSGDASSEQRTSKPGSPGDAAGGGSFAVKASGRDGATLPLVLLSPFHHVPAATAASLLMHHMAWHSRLGIAGYVWYVMEQAAALERDSRIQAAVAQGRLQLVLWDDMPLHEAKLHEYNNWDAYAQQAIIYNHGLLGLWGSDRVVVVADLDEFLVTARPSQGVTQVWRDCPAAPRATRGSGPLSGVLLKRVEMVCTARACRELEGEDTLVQLRMWLFAGEAGWWRGSAQRGRRLGGDGALGEGAWAGADGQGSEAEDDREGLEGSKRQQGRAAREAAAAAAGAGPQGQRDFGRLWEPRVHPLAHYDQLESRASFFKSIVDPGLVAAFSVHEFHPMNSTQERQLDMGCARFLHISSLFRSRGMDANAKTAAAAAAGASKGAGKAAGADGVGGDWMWPLKDMGL